MYLDLRGLQIMSEALQLVRKISIPLALSSTFCDSENSPFLYLSRALFRFRLISCLSFFLPPFHRQVSVIQKCSQALLAQCRYIDGLEPSRMRKYSNFEISTSSEFPSSSKQRFGQRNHSKRKGRISDLWQQGKKHGQRKEEALLKRKAQCSH